MANDSTKDMLKGAIILILFVFAMVFCMENFHKMDKYQLEDRYENDDIIIKLYERKFSSDDFKLTFENKTDNILRIDVKGNWWRTIDDFNNTEYKILYDSDSDMTLKLTLFYDDYEIICSLRET